jgi:hypothetical protein
MQSGSSKCQQIAQEFTAFTNDFFQSLLAATWQDAAKMAAQESSRRTKAQFVPPIAKAVHASGTKMDNLHQEEEDLARHNAIGASACPVSEQAARIAPDQLHARRIPTAYVLRVRNPHTSLENSMTDT